MKIACPSCQAQFEVAPEHAGKVAPCPQCGKPMQIPFPAARIVETAPAPAPAPRREPEGLDVHKIAKGVALGIIIALLIVIVAVALLGGYGASRTADNIQRAVQGLR